MLKLTDITWLYHHLPMRFSLTVERGEQVAILGPSGAGKSTLLNLIAGFSDASQRFADYRRRRSHHDAAVTPSGVDAVSGEQPVQPSDGRAKHRAGAKSGVETKCGAAKKMHAIAHQMGIDNLMARLPGELSGGQRQRVALARCLVREQPILLLDEPFSALDPALRQEMLTLVSSSCQQQKMTLLMVSHSVEDAARIATRSVVVADGRIAWQGKTDELLSGKASASALLGIKG